MGDINLDVVVEREIADDFLRLSGYDNFNEAMIAYMRDIISRVEASEGVLPEHIGAAGEGIEPMAKWPKNHPSNSIVISLSIPEKLMIKAMYCAVALRYDEAIITLMRMRLGAS